MEAQSSKKKNKVGILRLFCWQSSAVSVSLSTLVLIYVTIYCTEPWACPRHWWGHCLWSASWWMV